MALIPLRRQVQQAAAAQGLSPRQLCDRNCNTFKVRMAWIYQLGAGRIGS
jgi:methionyl-tRNA synthetase